MDEEVDTYLTRQCAFIKTRLPLQVYLFINQSGNQNIAISVRMCPLSNQPTTLTLNDDTSASGGNGVLVLE